MGEMPNVNRASSSYVTFDKIQVYINAYKGKRFGVVSVEEP